MYFLSAPQAHRQESPPSSWHLKHQYHVQHSLSYLSFCPCQPAAGEGFLPQTLPILAPLALQSQHVSQGPQLSKLGAPTHNATMVTTINPTSSHAPCVTHTHTHTSCSYKCADLPLLSITYSPHPAHERGWISPDCQSHALSTSPHITESYRPI